jgi:hypothetical protein
MNKSRLSCAKEALISVGINPEKAGYEGRFYNYWDAKLYEMEVSNCKFVIGIQKRTENGGELSIFIVNKSLKFIKKDLKMNKIVTPKIIFTLNRKSNGILSLIMGPEKGFGIDMLAFNHKCADAILLVQKNLAGIVLEENIKRTKKNFNAKIAQAALEKEKAVKIASEKTKK